MLGKGGLHKAKGLFPFVSDFFLAEPFKQSPPPLMLPYFTFSLQWVERWPPKTCLPSYIVIPGTWDVMLFGDSVFEDITEDSDMTSPGLSRWLRSQQQTSVQEGEEERPHRRTGRGETGGERREQP